MEPIDVLYDAKASKNDLRRALAKALGVAMPPSGSSGSLFSECKDAFLEAYGQFTGLPYRFAAREGMALQSVISQMRAILADKSDESVLQGFRALVANLPDWYKRNQFNLPVIDRKFNDIILTIKNERNGNKGFGKVSDDFKRKVLGDLLS